ncbi:hypothetical protein ACTXT7_007926, partial [Hymenolepis weldensis]
THDRLVGLKKGSYLLASALPQNASDIVRKRVQIEWQNAWLLIFDRRPIDKAQS